MVNVARNSWGAFPAQPGSRPCDGAHDLADSRRL